MELDLNKLVSEAPIQELNEVEKGGLKTILRAPEFHQAARMALEMIHRESYALYRAANLANPEENAKAARVQGQADGVEIFLRNLAELATGDEE